MYPDHIKILGRVYPLEFVPSDHFSNEESCFGECDFIDPKIRILEMVSGEAFVAECVLHETLEAVRIQLCMEISHEQLSLISYAVWQVMRENPILVEALWPGEEV